MVVHCRIDRKSTRLNSSHQIISYAVFCLKKKKQAAAPEIPKKAEKAEKAAGQAYCLCRRCCYPPAAMASGKGNHQCGSGIPSIPKRTAIKTGKGATSWLSHFRGTHPQYSHAFQIAHSRDLLLTENKESVLFFTFDDSFAQEFRAPTICATACSGVSDVEQASSRPSYSTVFSFRPRSLMTSRCGMPINSQSANITPARSFRSSSMTSAPLSVSVA